MFSDKSGCAIITSSSEKATAVQAIVVSQFRRTRWSVCVAVILAVAAFCCGANAQSSSATKNSTASGAKDGTLIETHSDKRVVQTGRWYVVRQFTVDFAVKCTNHTYCGEVTTTILNEVDDLMASKGQSVELLESGRDIDVTLQNGRHIKARQVPSTKCEKN